METADLDRFRKMAEEQAEREKKNRMVCENCGWFAARENETVGECHRYPPTLDMPPGDEWQHAKTNRQNVCGEFVHRKTGNSFQPDPYRAIAVRLARAEEELDRLRRIDAE
jgi:hypothetical protein